MKTVNVGVFKAPALLFPLEIFISPTLLELAREPGGSGFQKSS